MGSIVKVDSDSVDDTRSQGSPFNTAGYRRHKDAQPFDIRCEGVQLTAAD